MIFFCLGAISHKKCKQSRKKVRTTSTTCNLFLLKKACYTYKLSLCLFILDLASNLGLINKSDPQGPSSFYPPIVETDAIQL